MLNYIEFLEIPTKVALVLVGIFLILQIIGELLEFKGKIVPEVLKIRKYFARKKRERQALGQMPDLLNEHRQMMKDNAEMLQTLTDVKRLLGDIDKHYSNDNIAMRDGWMKKVNDHITDSEERYSRQDFLMRALDEKLDKNNADTLSLLIDMKRNEIINFASRVIDENYPVTREQFNRIFNSYEEYEEIIEKNGLTNGETDIAYRIITESYENHMRNHTFVEDVRGYTK